MWSLREPSQDRIERFLARVSGADWSYPEVGATAGDTPTGYDIDHNRALLGQGEEVFARARRALASWRMFPSPWTRISPPDAPIAEGTVVAMCARSYGLWWRNACRIVYTIDEEQPIRRFGFAYGTLPPHVETGEERFTVEWRPDDSVWYDLRAFSRPSFWFVRLAKPLARRAQKRFVRDSQRAMREACAEDPSR